MTRQDASFFRPVSDGMSIRLKVQPRSRAPGFHGLAPSADGPRLRLAVSAAADDGAANRAVIAALAAALDLAPSALTLTQGAKAREKTVYAAGDPARLGAALSRLAAA